MENSIKFKEPNWWQKRPKTERTLIIVVTILVALIVIILLAMNLSQNRPFQGCTFNSCDICLTSDCVKAASQVLEKIDEKVDPCDDFYQFACGSFVKNTLLPQDKYFITSFSIVEDEVLTLMKNVFEKPVQADDIRPFVLAKNFYQACMNTTEIEATSLKKFKELFNSTGGWPVCEGYEWDENNFNWISTSYKFMELGLTPFMLINFKILADESDSSKNALFLDQIDIDFDKNKRNGFNDTKFEAYYNYMTKVAIAFGANETIAPQEMRNVAELIIALTRITVPAEERRNSSLENNPMTISKVEYSYDYVPWLEYINAMLHPYKKMNNDDVIIVKIPSYYEQLKEILSNTPKRILANYMYWSLAESYITYLNDELRNLQLDFHKSIAGLQERPSRWKECTQESIKNYVASGSLFVRNFFNENAKKTLLEMVTNIKEEFMQTLRLVEWMDPMTKDHALKKAEAIHVHMAYPDELIDDQKLENYYTNFTCDHSDYLGCILNRSLFTNVIEYPTLDEPLDKKDWKRHAYVALAQAYYDLNENSIEFLAGILRNVFFDDTKPKYINYGAIGQIIGHEITHGFDDGGRQYDKDGNLVNWWKETTKDAFDAKAQCIIDQYGNITDLEVHLPLNGIKTQGENIADNAGIKIAYLAYQKFVKQNNGVEKLLPGLSYTPEQLFWISVAHVWCQVERTEYLKLVINYDTHAPSRYRVNVPLMNSEYFIKDFNCHAGSQMNPKHKCHVW